MEFQASVSDCSNPRLCHLWLCISHFHSWYSNTLHRYYTSFISVCHTRSFAHLSASRLRPSIPITHPILPLPSGSGSYCMPISPPILLLPLASRDSSMVARSYFSVVSWCHHASLLGPPSLYPVSLLHTSNKGHSTTHCVMVACRCSRYILVNWVTLVYIISSLSIMVFWWKFWWYCNLIFYFFLSVIIVKNS